MERDFLNRQWPTAIHVLISTTMINKTLQDRLDNSDTRSFTKSDWNMLIPFYATYDAVKYGARDAFKSRGEAIKYSLVWDVSALQMYSLMGALILKGLGLIGS